MDSIIFNVKSSKGQNTWPNLMKFPLKLMGDSSPGEDRKKEGVRLMYKAESLPFSWYFQVLTFCVHIFIRLKALLIYSEMNVLKCNSAMRKKKPLGNRKSYFLSPGNCIRWDSMEFDWWRTSMLCLFYMTPLSTSILKLWYLSIISPPSSVFVIILSLTSRRSKVVHVS